MRLQSAALTWAICSVVAAKVLLCAYGETGEVHARRCILQLTTKRRRLACSDLLVEIIMQIPFSR